MISLNLAITAGGSGAAPHNHFNAESAKQSATTVQWLGLEVIHSSSNKDKGYVEFIAHFNEHDKKNYIHEISEFHWVCPSGPVKADSRWRPEENTFKPRIISRLQAFITACEDTDYLPILCKASKLLLKHLQKLWPETNFIDLYPVFNEKHI